MPLTSVFNIPGIEEPSDDEVDYKQLYEQERKLRMYFEEQTKSLEQRLKRYALLYNDNRGNTHTFIQDVRSYKSMLPNSVKDINLMSHHSVGQESMSAPSLVKSFAIFGSKEKDVLNCRPDELLDGGVVETSDRESQIVYHAGKLVFPSKIRARHLSGRQAEDKCLEIMNTSADKVKRFILSFEPLHYPQYQEEVQDEVIDKVNKERRIYAICLKMEEFTVLGRDCEPHGDKSKKVVTFRDIEIEKLQIVVTERVYCIFSFYPFFAFFQEVIRRGLESVKVSRYIRYKENGQRLRLVDSYNHADMVKGQMVEIAREGNEIQLQFGKIIDFTLSPTNKIFLQLNQEACGSYLAVDWAYPLLSLFTLDDFLTTLTLLLLEQKIIFVCPDLNILTYAVFLFGKVLIRPFEYPYPIVSIMPDQQDYLNAPFPVIYGLCKTKKQFEDQNIPEKYNNFYIVLHPTGVEIVSKQKMSSFLTNRSPKLRDQLLVPFKKMNKNIPKFRIPWPFSKPETKDFPTLNIKQIAEEVLKQVYSYFNGQILSKLPTPAQVTLLKTDLQSSSRSEQEINERVIKHIKEQYYKNSKDPFFKAFLETQMVSVHLLQY